MNPQIILMDNNDKTHYGVDSSSSVNNVSAITSTSGFLSFPPETTVVNNQQFGALNYSADSTTMPITTATTSATNNEWPTNENHHNFSNSNDYSQMFSRMTQLPIPYSTAAASTSAQGQSVSVSTVSNFSNFSHSFAEAVASNNNSFAKKEDDDSTSIMNSCLKSYSSETTPIKNAVPKFEMIEYPRRLAVNNNCDYGNNNEFQNMPLPKYPNLAVSGTDLLNDTMAFDLSSLQLSDSHYMLNESNSFEKPIDQYFADSNNVVVKTQIDNTNNERKLSPAEYSKMLFDSRMKNELENNPPAYEINDNENENNDQANTSASSQLYESNNNNIVSNSDYYYNLYQSGSWTLDHLYILMLQQLAYDGFSHLAVQLLREKGLPARINPSNSLYSLVSNIINESNRNGDYVPNQNANSSLLLSHENIDPMNNILANNHLTSAIAATRAQLVADHPNFQLPVNNENVHIPQNIDPQFSQSQHHYSSNASSMVDNVSADLDIPPAPPVCGSVQHYHKKEKTGLLKICAKFGTLGDRQENFNMPHGFCIGINEDIVIADTNNHRISIFGLDGRFKFSFGQQGTQNGQLFQPRKIAMLPPAMLPTDTERPVFVVCDRGAKRSRMQLFSLEGEFIRLIDIPYMDIVSGLTTTQDRHIVIVDSVKSAVSVMNEAGIILNWFSCCPTMKEPSDIAVHKQEFFICDFKGNSVNVFNRHGTFLRKIVSDFTKFPNGIDISDTGDVMVGDSHGNRFHVTLFNDRSQYLGDLECPTLKVSRCCGLKITKSGYIVTLAKNNNHVLVMSPVKLNNHRVDV